MGRFVLSRIGRILVCECLSLAIREMIRELSGFGLLLVYPRLLDLQKGSAMQHRTAEVVGTAAVSGR